MRSKSNAIYAALAIMAAFLVLGGIGLFYVAYRGVRLLRSEASHAAAVAMGDASVLVGKADYIGTWEGGGITLKISPSGHAQYARKETHESEELNGSMFFDGGDLVIDVLVTKKHLHIDKPPHLDGARWLMTLDGVELERK